MFTGIIQDVGRITAIASEPQQMHIQVESTLDMQGWALGDSVAVNGCCLTITAFPSAHHFAATLSQETLDLTCFARAAVGDAVNLEPALRMGDALGGHMVSGHVDGVGTLCSITPVGEHRVFEFELPVALARYVVVKGSVAVHGVSLTVNSVDGCRFSVNLIPHTLTHTCLGTLKSGGRVNIETDMYGRYVERLTQFAQQEHE
ncbi:riboflavin synthase [Mariprofundus ferrooxydans]|uniref:Riboflavin synthase n=1 Tax=Mariprofundus ferrooxydans PV-1 TaxID=314345 RepID=Q0F2C8_9PROT|nr:riboflavin synthase [Mariprofundus ferrooxydans]EAU55622.1 riboflavin synthase subunit alpha [Mariprofundus ferrooxydans PV-1]KON48645.1 riboflavin synthase subunit alpha [Mariprofundus ferrooxydans]